MTVALEPSLDGLDSLIERVRKYDPDVDADLLRRAYDLADQAHTGQSRDSGAPYIEHPLEVARILADLNSDAATIAAGLLHDVVEDTSVSLEKIRDLFGEEVARLVDGVTKLSRTELSRKALEEALAPEGTELTIAKSQERAANIRKIFLAMAKDVRVMIVKLADRLHNMRTLDGVSADRQKRTAEETLQIFAPLAHRLGIWHFKWQLEDLSFKYLEREAHDRLADALARTRSEREEDVSEVRRILQEKLGEYGIKAEIQGRAKHLYSIYNKLDKQELTLNELYDLIAVRVIVDTVAECYHVLGVVHEVWLPIPGLFSDHIARPKPNMYQSLHTKVIGPRGEPIEIQIRTWEMHRTADFGIAAHWSYKEGGGRPDRRFEEKLTWMRQQLFDWQSDSSTDTEFMRSVVDDLFTDQVFVFTPHGDVIDLPVGSGPIDFAFRIHSELGLKIVGARVNGRMVALNHQFRNGDIVEIMTRPSAQPSYDWLNLVRTSHAKSRIRSWFRKQRHTENVAKGRDLLEKEVARVGADREVLKSERLLELARQMNYQHEEDLLAAVGHGHVAGATVVGRLRAAEPPKPQLITGRPAQEAKLRISAGGLDGLFIRRSRCCMPLPGEDVIGYITRGKGIAMHRECCANIQDALVNEKDRIQRVDWSTTGEEKYPVPLRIDTLDRVGVMADVSAVFSERKINI